MRAALEQAGIKSNVIARYNKQAVAPGNVIEHARRKEWMGSVAKTTGVGADIFTIANSAVGVASAIAGVAACSVM